MVGIGVEVVGVEVVCVGVEVVSVGVEVVGIGVEVVMQRRYSALINKLHRCMWEHWNMETWEHEHVL